MAHFTSGLTNSVSKFECGKSAPSLSTCSHWTFRNFNFNLSKCVDTLANNFNFDYINLFLKFYTTFYFKQTNFSQLVQIIERKIEITIKIE